MGSFAGKTHHSKKAKQLVPHPWKRQAEGDDAWTLGCPCGVVMQRFTTDETIADGWMEHHRCGDRRYSNYGGLYG